jgi:hypothetical protein
MPTLLPYVVSCWGVPVLVPSFEPPGAHLDLRRYGVEAMEVGYWAAPLASDRGGDALEKGLNAAANVLF